MTFDYRYLRRIMKKQGYSVTLLAQKVGLSRPYLSAKLHGRGYFTQSQIRRISRILGLNPAQINASFFKLKV